jgi:hypothetical protein
MNKALLVTIEAVGRRFAVMAFTALVAFAAEQWTHWLRNSLEGDPRSAAWIPAVWIALEFGQKLVREVRRAG